MAVTINGSTGVDYADGIKQKFGTGDDLEIFHDGNNNHIQGTTAGQSIYLKNDYEIQFLTSTNEKQLVTKANGACELYYDNVKKLYTYSDGAKIEGDFIFKQTDGTTKGYWDGTNARIHLWDNTKFLAGDNGDLEIYHNGTQNIIGDTTIQLRLISDAIRLRSKTGSETYLQADVNSSVSLNYDNVQKAATSSGGFDISGWVRPGLDDEWDVGHPSYRWDDIRATNGSIVTSDKNEKNTIVDSDLGLSFVNKLKPVSYKFNGKTRTHYGLIAQDVETTLFDISKPTSGFAGFVKDDVPDELYVDEGSLPEGKKVGDLKRAAYTSYGLRYNEFISPLIKAVQELSAEVETLKTKVAALEAG